MKHGDFGMTTQQASDMELDVAFSGPAITSNRFYVTVGPTVRIAFCEQYGAAGIPKFRTAVSLPIQDAIALTAILKQLLEPIEQQINPAIAAHEELAKKTPGMSNG
jgi:hypothetical protein